MPADRQGRDAAAEILAAYLRGEVDEDQLFVKFHHLGTILSEQRISDKFLDALLHEGPVIRCKHDIIFSKEEWPDLLRTLAFLKSDLTRDLQRDMEPDFDTVDRSQ